MNIWKLIFHKWRGRSPLHLLKMLRSSVAYLLWNYDRDQFELAFSVVLLLNGKAKRSLCLAFICNSTEIAGFLKFLEVFLWIPAAIPRKFIKNSQNDLLHAKVNV